MTKGEEGLPTGVVTVLLGDVEGSVRRWEADPDEMTRAMAALAECIDGAVAAHDGVRPLEQGEGDSFVAAFARPADAVACALAIQRRLLAGNGSGAPLHVRMAIHSQEAQLRDARNYEGALVHRAARLRALACGGQVLVSGTARALAADALPPDVSLVDLGAHVLRDVPEPERVWQVVHPDLPSAFPALRSPGAPVTNVPVQLTTFVGRTMELRTVGKLLAENRLVSLTGPGGVGKTRLAVEVAGEVADSYPHGVWFVDLSTVQDPAAVASAVASELRLREETARTPAERIATSFASDDVLLILDNCEHVVGAAATLVDALLRSCAGLDVLVTSREPLNVGGEAVYPVPHLALPGPGDDVDTVALADYDAVRLFVDRAHRADPRFELDERSVPLVASICDHVDGLPLGIELAAARLRVMSLPAIAASLSDRFRLLDGGPRTGQPRQQSLLASVSWSHDLLDDRERALLRRLAVFAGTFTIDAVEAVCAGEPLAEADAAGTFLGLVDKSLVAPAESGRYRLLETIRQFARDRLEGSGDAAGDLRRRHLEYLIAVAERSEEGVGGPDASEWLDRIDAELANVDDVLAWARDVDRLGAVRLASALVQYSFVRLNPLRGWWRLEAALPDDLDAIDDVVRAKALFGAGLLVSVCGEMALTISAPGKLDQALALYRQLGDRHGAARTEAMLGVLHVHLAGTEQGRPLWEAGLAELRALEDHWWDEFLTAVWGSVQVFRGRPLDGLPYLEEARTLAVARGYELIVRWAETWIAAAHGMLGEHRKAIVLAQRCLDEMPALHDPDSRSFLLGIVGNAHWELGDLDAAERFGHEAADVGGRHNVGAHEALGHALVGRVALVHGDNERARELFQRAVDIVAARDQGQLVARHACWLAEALVALGRVDESRAAIDRGEAAIRHIGPCADAVRLLLAAARLERRIGDDDAAEDRAHEALDMIRTVGGLQTAVTGLELLAGVAESRGSDAEAVRLFGAAARLREELERGEGHAKVDLAMARERLGADDFAQAWAEGLAMSLHEAIAYAARGRGTRKRPAVGWASLTPTELEVVGHVVEGLTNPQIGERMFISRGTVRTHLSHVFAKLGVASRSQLAAEAARRG